MAASLELSLEIRLRIYEGRLDRDKSAYKTALTVSSILP